MAIVQIYDGAVDKMIFGALTAVVIIVVTYHFIIKYQENKVHKDIERCDKQNYILLKRFVTVQ